MVLGVDHGQLNIASAESESDIDLVVELDRLSFATPWPRAMFLRALDDPTDTYIALARYGLTQGCVGFVCYILAADRVELATIAVAQGARRAGLGSALVGYALAEAKRSGASLCTLHVRVSNKEARRFYSRLGFEQSRVRHDYYEKPSEDALVLARRLDRY